MFKDIGKTIFTFGKVLFWIFLVGSIAMFIVGGMSGGTDMAIVLFLVTAICAFVVALPVCGFGKLIMDVSAIRSKLDA